MSVTINGKEIELRCSAIHGYNCAMATIDHLTCSEVKTMAFVDPVMKLKYRDELIKDFLDWLRVPKGVATGSYTERLAFYVFHDNIRASGDYETKTLDAFKYLFPYLYANQEKFGIGVTKSHIADNLWHTPVGSHPGQVWVLTPSYCEVFSKGKKISKEAKQGIKGLLTTKEGGYWNQRLAKQDEELLKSLL